MRRAVGLAVLVFAVLLLQGTLARFLPVAARPDLPLLVVLALALCWRSAAGGLLLAALSGYLIDLFSGGLLGLHALLWVVLFAGARALSLQVNLVAVGPQMLFAAFVTAASALGVVALTAFFRPGAGLGLLSAGDLALHAAANAVVAPFVTALVSAVLARLGDEETGRRLLRLEPRRRAV